MVGKVTTVYMLLCEANPGKAASSSTSTTGKTTGSGSPRTNKKVTRKTHTALEEKTERRQGDPPARTDGPAFHLNVQIHISAESTAEQIEQIFASMGKHLKQLSN